MKIWKRFCASIAAFAFAFSLAACTGGMIGGGDSSGAVEESSLSVSDPQEPKTVKARSIPAGEEAAVTYGFVKSVSSGSLTVDLASAAAEKEGENTEADASQLVSTGITKTILVDDACLLKDQAGNTIKLDGILKDMTVKITETQSYLISVEILAVPAAPAALDLSSEVEPESAIE